MKGYIVGKMIFIFFYLVLTAVYLIAEIRDPCWVSFIRWAGFACFFGMMIKDIVDVVRKKDEDT